MDELILESKKRQTIGTSPKNKPIQPIFNQAFLAEKVPINETPTAVPAYITELFHESAAPRKSAARIVNKVC